MDTRNTGTQAPGGRHRTIRPPRSEGRLNMDELGRLSQPLFDFLDRNSSAADTLSSIRGIAVTPGQVLARAAYQARLHAGGSVRVSNGSARRRGSIVVGQLEADLHCPCFHIKENQFVER